MNLQPLEDRIVVRPAEAEETTVSGLVIPDTAKEKPQQGEVLAVGPGRRSEQTGELIPIDIAVGDTVVYSKYGGTEITVDGEDLLILSARDVLAKVGRRQEEEVTTRTASVRRARRGRSSRVAPLSASSAPAVGRAASRAPWPTCSRPCRSGPRTTSSTNTKLARPLERARAAPSARGRCRRRSPLVARAQRRPR